jgi:glycosyltransferase involved in cell wall biosynthesis
VKILEIAGDPPTFNSGIASDLRLLRSGLTALGHSVSFLYPTARVGELKFSGIPLHRFSDYDVVHVHGPTPFLSDLITMNRSAKALVLAYHADVEWISPLMSSAYVRVHLMLHKKTQAIVVQSMDYLKRLEQFHANVRIIRPPGPLWRGKSSTLDSKPDRFTVLFVGQFRPFKGLGVLLAAAKQLPRIQFIVAGSGYLEGWLRNSTEGLQNVHLRINPTRAELEGLYSRSHVTCLPSTNTTEAYGFVLIEGALLGALPLASELPGVSENVRNLGGLLFPASDVASLVSQISALDENRRLWRDRARRSIDRATDYSEANTPSKWIRDHCSLFLNLTGQDP